MKGVFFSNRLIALLCSALFTPVTSAGSFEIEIGAFFSKTSTDIEVFDPLHQEYVDLNFESELNLPHDDVLPYLNLEYRFNSNHQIYFDWRSLHRNGYQDYVARPFQLTLEGHTYTIGGEANLLTSLNIDIMRLGYGYRFYNSEHLDVHFLAGFHVTKLELGMRGEIDVEAHENASSEAALVAEGFDSGITAPLPNLGFLVEHKIRDDILLKSHVHAFYLQYDEISGWMYELEMAARYYVTDNFSVTASFNYYDLGVGYEDEHTSLKVDYRFFGPMLKMAYRF
ncbi:outer membrane beta-barrel protein [Vibrio breoganii]|uniref:outer membrane beta-barrel protein n=1 Tax=Vibrio breoganii TaxID=553239 RepID=UPI000C83584C|nr:outer membrane beta-barrel protein [Vibrio breoganii]PMG05332.1 hypothetical protein BCV00_13060 [Vibrio breoganii]PMJ49596.1 hypothetical protein BCU21_18010 [Vibrio breoganii]PMK52068.1 hypothetical protein BCT97_17470 [Vibrio breoganii]PML37265.1 hypothetical protein BCT77_16075 [Vibrio breoganii]PMO30777.1 hypothetical protein BCT13_13565 [Vibrio breoganii]